MFNQSMFINKPLSLDILLWSNIQEQKYKRISNMFITLTEKDSMETITNINPSNNIIISALNDDDSIKRTSDGSLSLLLKHPINLSNLRALINGVIVLPFIPSLKFSVPTGIKLKFERPISSSYHNNIHKSLEIIQKGLINNEDNDNEYNIPDHLIYQNLNFSIDLNLERLKKQNNTIVLKKRTSIIDLEFSPTYFVGSPIFPSIECVYYVKNSEVFNKFNELF